jgi:sulfotransferase
MTKQYHFITGLPRSGSTLLTSILNQNPRFHSSISDPIAAFVNGMIETLKTSVGAHAEFPAFRRANTIRGMIDGYYEHIDKQVIFNTNRGWTYLTPQLKLVYPKAKMIVCVRDINWVLDSLETVYRKNPLSPNTVTGGPGKSVYERCDAHMEDTQGIVGFPYVGIKQAITGGDRDMLMLIEYNDLVKNTEKIVKAVYEFIGEQYFEHNFDNVEANWDEYDKEIGAPFHRVRKKIEFNERKTILPPDIQHKFSNMEVWRM